MIQTFHSAKASEYQKIIIMFTRLYKVLLIPNCNKTFFFHFVNKRASYPFGIISLAHAPVNVTRIIQSL